jgi:hypothetical protein
MTTTARSDVFERLDATLDDIQGRVDRVYGRSHGDVGGARYRLRVPRGLRIDVDRRRGQRATP